MYSYIITGIAFLIVFYNPINHMIWPNDSPSRPSGRPSLNESLIAIDDGADSILCPPDGYQTHILSRQPLVVYIENFISDKEIAHLIGLRYARKRHEV
jgi:prolyl 4-hydroxylase